LRVEKRRRRRGEWKREELGREEGRKEGKLG
jgi:hypothetical protein